MQYPVTPYQLASLLVIAPCVNIVRTRRVHVHVHVRLQLQPNYLVESHHTAHPNETSAHTLEARHNFHCHSQALLLYGLIYSSCYNYIIPKYYLLNIPDRPVPAERG